MPVTEKPAAEVDPEDVDLVHSHSEVDVASDEIGRVTNAVPPGVSWVEFAKNDDGWNWVVWSSNGRPLAVSALAYTRRHDAVRGLGQVAAALLEAKTPILVARDLPGRRRAKEAK